MPSGRHIRSGRTSSSRSSGSSRTGSSRGGSFGSTQSGSRHHSGTRRTTVIIGGGGFWMRRRHWGRTNGGLSTIAFFSVICLFASLIGYFVILSSNKNIEYFKTEHTYYQQMIISRIATREAKVTDHIKNDKGDKWWFKYTIIAEPGDEGYGSLPTLNILKGYSLPIYNLDELPLLNSTITVVLSLGPNITEDTNSVPDHLSLTKVENDGDYIGTLSSKHMGVLLLIIGGSLFAVLVVVGIVLSAKLKQQHNKNDKYSAPSQSTQPQTLNCPYCGAKLDVGNKKCPNCGAATR